MDKPDLCAVMAGTRWSSLLCVERRTTTDHLVRMTLQAAGGCGRGSRGVHKWGGGGCPPRVSHGCTRLFVLSLYSFTREGAFYQTIRQDAREHSIRLLD